MALFARRRVQEAIDRCAQFMQPRALARKVAELNAANKGSLPAEWELMVAAHASAQCALDYEPDLGGNRYGDLYMMPDGAGTLGSMVEIITISDRHAHAQNPVDRVCIAIRRRLHRMGLPKGGVHVQVAGKTEGPCGDARMMLQLGTRSSDDLFDDAFKDFVRRVKAAPASRHDHHWEGPGLDIELRFDPAQRFAGGGHLSYVTPYSRTRNPLFSALKSKCDQLKGTGHGGPFGVIVCDGGCNLLGSGRHRSGGAFSLHDILDEHFKSSRRLSFVLVLHVEARLPSFLNGNKLVMKLHSVPCLRHGSCALAAETLRRLCESVTTMPIPINSGDNAARCNCDKGEAEGWRFPGGSITMSGNKIRLSSRALLEMLAGDKTIDQLFAACGQNDFFPGNHFATLRRQGRLISQVELVRGPNDDDEIEFTFGRPDAAVVAYHVPTPPSE